MNAPSTRFPWILLFGRAALFLAIQAIFALVYVIAGTQKAWDTGSALWPFVVTVTNVICLLVMIQLFRGEGKNYWEIFRIRRETIKGDLLPLLGALVIAGPLGFLPNVLLGQWLFDDPQTIMTLLVRPLPLWIAYVAIVLFPITQGLAELPTYFAYVMPRLAMRGLPRWLAVALPALMLGLQHLAMPFVFDMRFIAWRALMFIPFAFLVAILLYWRPRFLPYLAITHVLMDLSFASMLLSAAY